MCNKQIIIFIFVVVLDKESEDALVIGILLQLLFVSSLSFNINCLHRCHFMFR